MSRAFSTDIISANHQPQRLAHAYTPLSTSLNQDDNPSTTYAGASNEKMAELIRIDEPTGRTCTAIAFTVPQLEAAIRHKDHSGILNMHQTCAITSLDCNEPLLIQGLRTRDHKVVEILLGCGVSPEEQDESGRNSFHWLFILDESALLAAESLLSEFRNSKGLNAHATQTMVVHPQWPLQLRGTPLAHAISAGNRAAVDTLIQLGANPLAQDCAPKSLTGSLQNIWTPIHIAVQYHCPDILKSLLNAARNEALDTSQHRPLVLPAAALCHSSILERMAMHGRKCEKRLEEVIELLGPPTILEELYVDGTTAFMQSIATNDLSVTTAMLRRNNALASIKAVSSTLTEAREFHYPIHHAAHLASRRDDPQVLRLIELLVKYDARTLFRLDSNDRTPLHIASSGTSSRAALFMLEQAPSLLQSKDKLGASPLHYCESAEVAEELLALGVEVNASDTAGKSALCNAVVKGLGPVIKVLCKGGATPDICAGTMSNPLHIAIRSGLHEVVTTLIAFGASVDTQDSSGNTTLHVAARRSPRHMLISLLKSDPDVSILNKRGESALHTAVIFDNFPAMEEISRHSPELILTPLQGLGDSQEESAGSIKQSPLFLCAQKDNAIAINWMIPFLNEAEVERQDQIGRNILHYAIELGNIDLVAGLIRMGVDLDVQDLEGDTALTLAVRCRSSGKNDNLRMCRLLIGNGAAVAIQNNAGETAWDIAVNDIQDETYSILALLLNHSAEACRNVTWQKTNNQVAANTVTFLSKHDREPCGQYLIRLAVHRPSQRLLMALKNRMPPLDYRAVEPYEIAQRRARIERRLPLFHHLGDLDITNVSLGPHELGQPIMQAPRPDPTSELETPQNQIYAQPLYYQPLTLPLQLPSCELDSDQLSGSQSGTEVVETPDSETPGSERGRLRRLFRRASTQRSL